MLFMEGEYALVSSTGAVLPTTSIHLGWRVQLHSMTGPRAAELNGTVARVRGEKRHYALNVPVDPARQPFVTDSEKDNAHIDRWFVELESGTQSQILVKPAKLAAVCAHVPCRTLLHAPKVCSKCKVARVPECPLSVRECPLSVLCTRVRARAFA